MSTHEVFNQAEPLADANLWRLNRPLQEGLRAWHPAHDAARFDALGAELGGAQMQQHARLANVHHPQLLTHSSAGHRLDEVEFHPSYHVLLGAALRQGLHGSPWSGAPGSHVERAAAFMLFTELEPSVLCPVSMTYAVTPSLRANAALHAEFGPRLAAREYEARLAPPATKSTLTMGMGMTEKQGGSDVRANTTRAEFVGRDAWGERWRLTGHKWFLSAPMCDAFLVLARTDGPDGGNGRAGADGLSCFFVPRVLADGGFNPLRIQRLKHKLGNQANASSEVEFEGATAWLVGEPGHGVAQILAMGALTRLDCALGTAGLMRQALSIAIHHTRQRAAFGRTLATQPLMKNVLADLALESEAATLLARARRSAVDRTEHGQDADGLEALMRRVLTPVAKFWICKRGAAFAQEAMECLGGNGYVEEQGRGVMARIYREMPVNSIWEGSANIMALDLLRALRGGGVAEALMHEAAEARRAHRAVARLADGVARCLAGAVDEVDARRVARDVALLAQAAQLRAISPEPVFAAFCDARIAQGSDAFGMLAAGAPIDGLITRAMPANTR
jgi:putative acyl-CoA dehydrogenase